MKKDGRTRKNRIPRYGFVWNPRTSSPNTTRNSTALTVVSHTPNSEIGLRAWRT